MEKEEEKGIRKKRRVGKKRENHWENRGNVGRLRKTWPEGSDTEKTVKQGWSMLQSKGKAAKIQEGREWRKMGI